MLTASSSASLIGRTDTSSLVPEPEKGAVSASIRHIPSLRAIGGATALPICTDPEGETLHEARAELEGHWQGDGIANMQRSGEGIFGDSRWCHKQTPRDLAVPLAP